MKQRNLFLVVPILFLSSFLFGQGQDDKQNRLGEKYEKMEQMKIAFITHKLNLDSEEAQRFWPVYNEYQQKRQAIKTAVKERAINSDKPQSLDASARLKAILDMEEDLHNLKKEYMGKLRSVISDEQLISLIVSEREFKKKIIEGFKKGRKHSH